jgi:AraC-like DNA-binding protein
MYLNGLNLVKQTTLIEIKGKLEKVKAFIDINYTEKLTLSKLSKQGLLCDEYLIRMFRMHYGITPYQYVIQKRIHSAKFFLQKGLSITDTSRRIGYEDIASFSKLFKKHTGVSPSVYQGIKAALA